MQEISVAELNPHLRNTDFFDDMDGAKWTEFLESIRTSGVIEPVVATLDKTIVSGHQRVRACKELGIEKVMCEFKDFGSDDEALKAMIETNIRQRGTIGGSDLKAGRRIKELERIYGIHNGNNQHVEPSTNGVTLTQVELLKMLDMDRESYRRYKKLVELPKEFQDMVEEGTITSSTASRVISALSEQEQMKLLAVMASMPAGQKFTQAQTQSMVDSIKSLEEKLSEVQKLPVADDYLRVVAEKKAAVAKARKVYEEAQVLKKENANMERRLEKAQEAAADAEARLDNVAVATTSVSDIPPDYLATKAALMQIRNENDELRRKLKETALDSPPLTTVMRNLLSLLKTVDFSEDIVKDWSEVQIKATLDYISKVHSACDWYKKCLTDALKCTQVSA